MLTHAKAMSALKPKALHSSTVWVGGRKSSSDPYTAVHLGWSWQVYSERGCLLATVIAGSNYISNRLYSDSWTSPLEGIVPGLTNGYSLV